MNLIGNINAIPFRRFRGGGGVAPFPSIPGMIARYSALGLTNERMATNPVWVDKTGNGHDLQMKNFAWGGMSGVGGYVENYSIWVKSAVRADITFTDHSFNVTSVKINQVQFYYQSSGGEQPFTVPSCTVIVKGLTDGQVLEYIYTDIEGRHVFTVKNDGIYTLPSFEFIAKGTSYYGFRFNKVQESCNITIEQLPLYPGFILGDGVDDLAVTEKELNFEDTYTVYTAFIPFQNNPTRNMILCGADSKKTFSMQYSSLVYVSFIAGNNYYINADFVNGLNLFACKRNGNNIYIKNLLTNKVVTGTCGDWVENAGLYYLWKNATYASFAKAAIAGQTICNGYFSTDEDDEKVLDWYKKQYPWLFFDQAWTVVGKTNEDEDRATIANITGNGNDLVLSNFGFAEGSGYGLYKTPFELYPSVQHSSKYSLSFSKFALGDHNLIIAPKQNDLSYDIKVKVTGLKDGVKFKWGWIGTTGYIDITTDGIHMLNKPASQIRQLIVEFAEDFDPDHVVTIEQIPEYEGYLVTDGVDDKVESSLFTLNKDWTIVGNWTMLSNIPSNCGIIKVSSMFLYNSLDGVTIYFAGGPIKIQSKSINAFCSDGRIYLNDWTEILKPDAQIASGGSKSSLNIASYSANFTKMAFKNLAIYDGKNLSKDDCIKAYNYLQTLKAK